MTGSSITHAIVDNDGVLRREGKQLPGVPELFASLNRCNIKNVILSNNSRVTSDGILRQMHSFGVPNFTREQAMTTAEAAGEYFHQRNNVQDNIFLIGETGVREAFKKLQIPVLNGSWNGEEWIDGKPTHVVCGFKDSALDYKNELAPAWNAIHQGAKLIVTNSDSSYGNAMGNKVPANGAQANYFWDVAPNPKVLGKPEIGMAEVALGRLDAQKSSSRIAVIGDTLEQDMQLADNLRNAGWHTEAWMVLTGDTSNEEACEDPRIQRIFSDICEVRKHILGED